MHATLFLTAALAVGQPPTGNDRPAAPPGTPGTTADRAAPPGNVSLDGNWTVVSLEKNGQPVPNAANMTVTVRGNTVTFDAGKATGQPAAGQNQMRAMRLDFGRDGRVYVTEANAEGKFDIAPGTRPDADRPGTDRPGAGGADRPPAGTAGVDRPSTREERLAATGAGSTAGREPPRSGAAVRPGEPAIPAGTKSGVYVLTQDYFAVCIHEENRPGTSPGTGDRPGTGGLDRPGTGTDRPGTGGTDRPAGDRPPPAPAAGTDRPAPVVTPGGSVVGDPGTNRPGAGGTAGQDRPGAGTGTDRPGAGLAGGMMPQNRSYVTVILKRSGAGAGQPGGGNRPTDR